MGAVPVQLLLQRLVDLVEGTQQHLKQEQRDTGQHPESVTFVSAHTCVHMPVCAVYLVLRQRDLTLLVAQHQLCVLSSDVVGLSGCFDLL